MSNTLQLIGVTKDAKTAGPGKRFELFTKGCIRGVINPCAGCFNEETWTFEGKKREMDSTELADIIKRDAWNRQVTFCGGEPILQAKALTALAKELKEHDPTFHIIMYTAYKLDTLMKHGLKFTWVPKYGAGMYNALSSYSNSTNKVESEYPELYANVKHVTKTEFTILTSEDVLELMKYVDIIVDGDYKAEQRLTTAQYMHEGWFIGSANQRVIFTKSTLQKGELSFMGAANYNHAMSIAPKCKCCGHANQLNQENYCSDLCKERHQEREELLVSYGL